MTDPVATTSPLDRRLLAVPFGLLVLGLLTTAGLWYWLQTAHLADIRRVTEDRAAFARTELTNHMNYRIAGLQRMARRWAAAGGTSQALWEDDAVAYYEDQPEFEALAYADQDNILRWVIPKEGNERFVGFNLAYEAKRTAALARARETKQTTYSGIVDLADAGVKGVLVIFPLEVDGALDGFLVAVFNVPELMQFLLPNMAVEEFAIQLSEDGTEIFAANTDAKLVHEATDRRQVQRAGLSWVLEVTPHTSLENAKATVRIFAISLGLIATALLSLSAYFVLLNIAKTRRKASVALRNQLTIDSSQVGIWEWPDTNDKKQYWSVELYKLFGLEPGELSATYDTFESLIYPEDRLKNRKAIRSDLDADNVFQFETRMRKKDGTYEWFEFRGSRRFNKSGSEHFFAACTNIHKRKLAEQKAQDASAFQNLIFENIPALLFVKDEQFRIVNANPAFLSVYPPEMRDTVIGTTTLEEYNQEEAEEFLRDDKLAFTHGKREVEETVDFPDGKRRTLATKKVRFENSLGEPFILGVAHDITDMKEMTAELAISERRYRLATTLPSVGLWEQDFVTDHYFWSDSMRQILGLAPDAPIPGPEEYKDAMHPDDREAFTQAFRGHLDNREPYDIEHRQKHADGSYRWLRVRGQAEWDETGKPTRIAGSSEDITERKLAEQALERSEEQFRSSMENSAAGMALLSPNGEWLSVNSALCEILGYSAEELYETTFQALTHPDDIDMNMDNTAKMLSGELERYQVEKRYIHKDGHTIWGLLTTALVWNPDGTPRHFISQILDVTTTKTFEQALLQSNKDLDDFAYIASHDLKEPLRGIHNYSRFLIEDYEKILDEDGQHKLGRIMHLTQRMEALINDLLQFSRLGRDSDSVADVNINDVVAEIDDMLPDQDAFALVAEPDMPIMRGDEVRIKEVFRNLITNGIKYNQSDQKRIEVGTTPAQRPEHKNSTTFYVKDNGIGIESRFHQDVFKMFKRLHHREAYGGGSGAGLAFVKKTVERLGGDIWLMSEPGEGSTFYFTLPND